MTEIWKPIPGFEGKYEVSNLGRVKSLARTIIRSNGWPRPIAERILRPGPRPSGHLTVALQGVRTQNVHTLVLLAFVGPRPTPQHQARHINGDEKDNRVENLEWATRSVNTLDRKWHKGPDGTRKLTGAQAAEAKRLINSGSKVSDVAKIVGISYQTAWRIKQGVTHADA